jgi:hypothetical protein
LIYLIHQSKVTIGSELFGTSLHFLSLNKMTSAQFTSSHSRYRCQEKQYSHSLSRFARRCKFIIHPDVTTLHLFTFFILRVCWFAFTFDTIDFLSQPIDHLARNWRSVVYDRHEAFLGTFCTFLVGDIDTRDLSARGCVTSVSYLSSSRCTFPSLRCRPISLFNTVPFHRPDVEHNHLRQ